MKFAIVAAFCLVLQQHIPLSVSVSQCSTDQYTGGALYAPIDVDTSYATQVPTVDPLTIIVADNEHVLIKNTGSSVEAIVNQPKTGNIICGGVLGKNIYVFHKLRFYWDHDFAGDASYSIDRSEFPLSAEFIYYKQSSGSIENAYSQPEGILVIRVQISVEGAVPNPQFSKFEYVLQNLTKAGSSYPIKGSVRDTVCAWYDQTSLNYPFYYSYSGTYYDVTENSTICYDAIYLLVPKSKTGYISICQFAAFTNLLNSAGKPIEVVQTAYPSRGRNLKQATGIVEKILPISY